MRHPLVLTLVSAVLFVLAFPPYGLWPLAFFCLVPWLRAVRAAPSGRAALGLGVLLSVLITVGGYHFVAKTLNHFGHLPWPLAILGCVIFGTFNQVQLVFFGYHYRRVQTSTRLAAWGLGSMVAVYCALDWIIPKLFMDSLGLSLVGFLPLAQWASHVGMYGLTVLIVAWNIGLADVLNRPSAPAPPLRNLLRGGLRDLRGLAAVTTVLMGLGYAMQFRATPAVGNDTLKTVVIQANIGDLEKVASERGWGDAPNLVVQKYLEITQTALLSDPTVDAVLWPETAYPSTFLKPNSPGDLVRQDRILALARETGVPFWLGGYDRDGRHDYNAVFFLPPLNAGSPSPAPSTVPVYRKTVLLPFAEYIPGAESIAWIRNTFPQVGFFGRGDGPSVRRLELSGGRSVVVHPMICYEALFGSFARAARKLGAQVIVNFTNDSWFGPWGEPQLHLALSQMRSIEGRLPQIRATNTGISTAILPSGQLVGTGPIGLVAALPTEVSLRSVAPGLYVVLGPWMSLLLTGYAVWALWRRRRVGR